MSSLSNKKLYPNSTQFPNLLGDHFMYLLTGNEWKVLYYFVRRTFGFRKDSDNLTIRQICEGNGKRDEETGELVEHGTGLSRGTVINILKVLCDKTRLIIKGPQIGRESTFELNLDRGTIDLAWFLERRDIKKRTRKKNITRARELNPKVTHPVQQDGLSSSDLSCPTEHARPVQQDRTYPVQQDTQKHSRNIEREIKPPEPPEDFSDLLSPRERHHEPSAYDLAFAEKKASMTTKQFESWLSLGGPGQLRREMGETAWTAPVDAKTDELDGDFLVAEFCAHLEIDPKVLPTKTKKAWRRQLTKPAVERNIPFEGALKALRLTLNFQIGPLDWMRRGDYDPIISKPAHPKFLEAYESMLLKEASGTLDSFIERRQKNGVRSSSGRAAQGGGPSEDARRRGAAVEAIVERRRREAQQEMPSLRGASGPPT